MILQDMHLHTNYSDGKNSPEEMIRAAISLGISNICFTDHVRKDSLWVVDYINELESLKSKFKDKIRIDIGVEAKVLDFDGCLDCPEIAISNEKIKIVAAIHRLPKGNGEFIRRDEIVRDKKLAIECWMNAVGGLKSNNRFERLAHPFSLFDTMGINKFDLEIWNSVIILLKALPAKIEYNVKYSHSMVPDFLWDTLKGKLIFGSDSHSIYDIKKRFPCLRDLEMLLS